MTGKPKKTKSNLAKRERDALKELSERTDVLITNADKSGAAVIWETRDYIIETNRQRVHSSTNLRFPCTDFLARKMVFLVRLCTQNYVRIKKSLWALICIV